jgi:hypothetical protein
VATNASTREDAGNGSTLTELAKTLKDLQITVKELKSYIKQLQNS